MNVENRCADARNCDGECRMQFRGGLQSELSRSGEVFQLRRIGPARATTRKV